MLVSLLAYDAAGNVVATLGHMVAKDTDGNVIGLIDFEAHERAGGKLRDIWDAADAVGSGTWPEWLGARVHDFRVELGPDKRIAALIHAKSGYRRDRATLEAAIAAVQPDADGVRDIRALVGGPTAPLVLDDQGRTVSRTLVVLGTPAHLPLIGRGGTP